MCTFILDASLADNVILDAPLFWRGVHDTIHHCGASEALQRIMGSGLAPLRCGRTWRPRCSPSRSFGSISVVRCYGVPRPHPSHRRAVAPGTLPRSTCLARVYHGGTARCPRPAGRPAHRSATAVEARAGSGHLQKQREGANSRFSADRAPATNRPLSACGICRITGL